MFFAMRNYQSITNKIKSCTNLWDFTINGSENLKHFKVSSNTQVSSGVVFEIIISFISFVLQRTESQVLQYFFSSWL